MITNHVFTMIMLHSVLSYPFKLFTKGDLSTRQAIEIFKHIRLIFLTILML